MADTEVIYGWFPHHKSFAVVPAAEAEQRAAVVDRVVSVKTLGDLRTVYREFGDTFLPVNEEELLSELEDGGVEVSDETPFDWQALPGVEDGDWPKMPTQITLDRLPAAVLADLRLLSGAQEEATVFNGDYLALPATVEGDLVDVLRKHGFRVRRDDSVVHQLSGGDALWS